MHPSSRCGGRQAPAFVKTHLRPQAAEWQLLTLVLLKALSLHRVPQLQDCLDGREGLMRLQHEACRLGSSVEELGELLLVICEEE